MRKLVFIIFVILVLFLVNLVFYIVSEDYRFFVKKIKYSDEIVYEGNLEVDDIDTESVVIPDSTGGNSGIEVGSEEVIISDAESIEFLDELKKTDTPKQELILGNTEKEILELFADYDLKELTKHASLFDITTEYPDDYFEYYSKDIVVYLFSTKTYKEVYNIFDILSYELPYDTKEVNNFGQSSFYINLKEVYTDEYVRVVVQYKNKAFGLKIHKDVYNDVKQILEDTKPQG